MTNERYCQTRLVADTPAEKDAFGGHERVAQSIVEVLRTEDGGRSIGLEGGWGAGKSTIVNLVSKKLSQTRGCDYEVIVFDTWAHQDDPLRRTFLENLINRIQDFGWVKRKEWDRILAELTKRRREDTTRVVPKLTGTGILFALFLLLSIPVGSVLISASATLLTSQNGSTQLAIWFFGGGVVVLLVPVILFLVMLGNRRMRRSKADGSGQNEGLNELPALVTGQASTESRTIVTQTPDPTSVEFAEIFRSLLSEALKPENRKLLLVIDNLDRVQPSDALSIWSTLQTFLGHSDYQRANWIDRLWLLIPYDRKAILRLWDRSGIKSDLAPAASFLDKTFQLKFEAPPLLLLNWRDLLNETLQQALPNHADEDFRNIYRAYAVKSGFESSAPTPRDLKIFVNQIGALHREWQHDFSLSDLACYVLFQKDDKDVRKVLLHQEDSEFPRRIIGARWREKIAAMHFGVPVKEARQLLLRGPIESALDSGDWNRISEIESTHSAGFWTVLEGSVPAGAQGWNDLTPSELALAATALGKSRIFDQIHSRPEATALLSSIETAVAEVEIWRPFNTANVQGMIEIGRLVGASDHIIPALLRGASNAPVEIPEGEQRGIDSISDQEMVTPSVWMSSAITLTEGLIKFGFDKQVSEGVRVPLSAQEWIQASHAVVRRDPNGQLFQYFDLQSIEELDEMLAGQVSSNQINENTVSAAQTAMATRTGNSMTNVATAVFSRLRSNGQFQGELLTGLLRILRFSKASDIITKEQYEGFATSGYFLHHLYFVFSEKHPEAIAECMFGYLNAVPDAREPAHVGNSNNGYTYLTRLLQDRVSVPGVAEHFTGLAKDTQQLRAVFEMAGTTRPIPPFVAKVLRTLLVSADVSTSVELVRENWHVIREVLEMEYDSLNFGAFLKAHPELHKLVAAVVDDTFEHVDSGLYLALLKNNAGANFVSWCADGLSSVKLDSWSKELESQGDLVELAIELKANRIDVALGVAYADALTAFAKSVASDLEEILPDVNWPELLLLLNSDQKELIPRGIYEILEETNGDTSPKFFTIFGDMLSDQNLLSEQQRFIHQVCRPILEKDNAEGISWIANVVESYPRLLTKNADSAAANDFKDRIRHRLNITLDEDPTLRHLQKIGSVFGIKRRNLK